MLTLLYGRSGWWAAALAERGWNIVFAFPGEGWVVVVVVCVCVCVCVCVF
jgi:ABC-type sulfate transport system permease subunit